jgi:hypothetical protein
MTRPSIVVASALVLTIVGLVGLAATVIERRLAQARRAVAVLAFDESQQRVTAVEEHDARAGWLARRAFRETGTTRGLIQYWRADYGDLTEIARAPAQTREGLDPALVSMAANAAYRAAQGGPQDRTTLLRNLDAAVRAYADAVDATGSADAAYNYEFAVRMRAEIGSGKRRRLPSLGENDDPGRLHGVRGGPPEPIAGSPFRIRIPQDSKGIEYTPAEAAGSGFVRRRPG